MKFDDAEQVNSICWQLRQADIVRGADRARINSLFNGAPPYSPQEVEENEINVNVNSLESTVIGHDARSQYYQAFLKPGNFFKLHTDAGSVHKREKYSTIVTKAINRPMKRSLSYFETLRSKFANNVLHGIGPSTWPDRDCWNSRARGVEDLLIPGDTVLSFEDLPFFAVLKSYTAPELIRLTRGAKVDPAWNVPLVKSALEWIDKETLSLLGSTYGTLYSPEKVEERVKSDGGFYAGDQVPRLDTFDFYYWSDEEDDYGWRRRIIIDDWGTPDGQITSNTKLTRKGDLEFGKGQWLYNSGSRKFADKREEIFSCQFADLSAVGPFHYHSVRSLGYLMFAICHLQNRLRCKFQENVMETMMMLFRVKSQEDVQRVLKTNLINKGFVDESLSFIPAAERFQVNAGLVELGLRENQSIIAKNSSSYTQNPNFSQDRTEKTATQFQGELASMTTLVSASLTQAYQYQNFEYYEIVRRFMRRNSADPDVRAARADILRQGVPEKILEPNQWECEPERVMSPSKAMEMAIAEWLMQHRDKYDPEAQRTILRDVTLAVTDDPAKADRLVPEQPHISDSIHDAQLAFGSLMAGGLISVRPGLNELEYIPAMLASMASVVKRIEETGGMTDPKELGGLSSVAKNVDQHIQILAKDETNKSMVKQFADQLGQITNLLKGYAQRLQEQAAKQNGNGQPDPEVMAKIQAQQMQAEAKTANARESHAQKTAQRQVAFEMKTAQQEQQHALDLQKQAQMTASEIAATAAKTAAQVEAERIKAENAPAPQPKE